MDEAIDFADRALYLPAVDTAVCADLHLGREATTAIEFPLGEPQHIQEQLTAVLDRFAPETLVLAGDILDAFDYIPTGVEDTLGAIVDLTDKRGTELVVLRGNHDPQLEELSPVPVYEQYRPADRIVVHHGDTAVDTDGALEVVGHIHPTIVIEGQRRPCFLYDPAATPPVVVLPALNPLTPGVAVNNARTADLPSSVVADIDRLRPIVYDTDTDESLQFPPLGSLRPLL